MTREKRKEEIVKEKGWRRENENKEEDKKDDEGNQREKRGTKKIKNCRN